MSKLPSSENALGDELYLAKNMSYAKEVNNDNFKTEVLDAGIPVLVDFWAPWCQPCQILGPILEELAQDMEGKVKVAKVNVDEGENQPLAMEYQIQGIPALKLFKGGEVVKEFVGLQPKESLKKEIEEQL